MEAGAEPWELPNPVSKARWICVPCLAQGPKPPAHLPPAEASERSTCPHGVTFMTSSVSPCPTLGFRWQSLPNLGISQPHGYHLTAGKLCPAGTLTCGTRWQNCHSSKKRKGPGRRQDSPHPRCCPAARTNGKHRTWAQRQILPGFLARRDLKEWPAQSQGGSGALGTEWWCNGGGSLVKAQS